VHVLPVTKRYVCPSAWTLHVLSRESGRCQVCLMFHTFCDFWNNVSSAPIAFNTGCVPAKNIYCSRLWFRSQHTRALHSIWNRPFLWSSFGRRNWLTVVACHNKRLQCEIFGRNRVRAIDLQFQIVLPFRLHGPFFSGVQKALAR
jgi:hypothetical protein